MDSDVEIPQVILMRHGIDTGYSGKPSAWSVIVQKQRAICWIAGNHLRLRHKALSLLDYSLGQGHREGDILQDTHTDTHTLSCASSRSGREGFQHARPGDSNGDRQIAKIVAGSARE